MRATAAHTYVQARSQGPIIKQDCTHGLQGVVAVACTDPQSFNQRVDSLGSAPAPHAVLVWNFRDPIHPELVLESPYELFCFQSNPLQPEVITGGCYNGQIIMWDTATQEVGLLPSAHPIVCALTFPLALLHATCVYHFCKRFLMQHLQATSCEWQCSIYMTSALSQGCLIIPMLVYCPNGDQDAPGLLHAKRPSQAFHLQALTQGLHQCL